METKEHIPDGLETSPAFHGDIETAESSLEKEEIRYPSPVARSIIIVGLMLSMFLVALDMSIIATAVPTITTEFESMADVGWYGSAFFMTLSIFQSVWGKAYKYFSLRGVFLTAIGLFEIGSLVCALAPNSVALIVGRAIQGAGGAGLTGGCYIITAFIAPPTQVPVLIGLFGCVFSISSVIGPLLGGVFSESVTWRWCFYLNLPVGGVAVACLVFFFRTPPHAKAHAKAATKGLNIKAILARFDPPGIVLLMSGLICLLIALQWAGHREAWGSATIIGLLVGWILLTLMFYATEWYQGDRALMVLRILAKRDIAVNSIFVFFLNAANFALIYNLPTYFQAIGGSSPIGSGLKNIPTILSSAIFTLISATLVGKMGIYQPFLLVGGALSTIGAGLIYTFGMNTTLGPIIGYQIIYGSGVGIAVQVPILVAQALSTGEDQAMATSNVLTFQFMGAAYGVASTDSILNNLLLGALPKFAPSITPQSVTEAGSSGLQNVFNGEVLTGVQRSYLAGLKGSWALSIALFGVTVLCALVPKWPGSLRTKGDPEKEKDQDGDTAIPMFG